MVSRRFCVVSVSALVVTGGACTAPQPGPVVSFSAPPSVAVTSQSPAAPGPSSIDQHLESGDSVTSHGVAFRLPAHIRMTESSPGVWTGGGAGSGACTITVTSRAAGSGDPMAVLVAQFPRQVKRDGGEVAKNALVTPAPAGFVAAVDQSWLRVMPGGWRALHSARTVILGDRLVSLTAVGSGDNVLDCDTERLTQDVRAARAGVRG